MDALLNIIKMMKVQAICPLRIRNPNLLKVGLVNLSETLTIFKSKGFGIKRYSNRASKLSICGLIRGHCGLNIQNFQKRGAFKL